VLVTLACPKPLARCAGRMTIFSRPYRRSKIVALRRERRLRRTTFVLPGGRTKTFELRLSRLDRRLLHRAGRMSVRAHVVTSEEVRTVNGTLIARTIHSRPRRS
jgi:hypothetical protein